MKGRRRPIHSGMAGTILTSARRDLSNSIKGAIALAVICAIVFGFNWRYVYNFVAGPFPFDRFDAGIASPSITRAFVRGEGPMLAAGWAEESTVGLLRGLVDRQCTSSQFLAMRVDRRP